MQPYSPDDNVVNAFIDNAGGVNLFGIRPAFADVKYLMTQTESRPRLPDEDIIAALKTSGRALEARAATHKNYWDREEQKQQTETTAKNVAKEIATRPVPGGDTPTPVTSVAKGAAMTGSTASKALQSNPLYDSGKSFEGIPGFDSEKFLKVFPRLKDGSPDLSNPEYFYVGGIAPLSITAQINAGYGVDRVIAYVNSMSTGTASGGGGGGSVAPATTYSIQQIGAKVFSVGSDRSVVLLPDIDPGYAKYEVNREGTLVGFRADGSSTELQKGWDFAKQDPALVVKQDVRTGESLLVNTRDPSQPPQSLGTFDFAAIDPERTTAESALQSRLGIASNERASDQNAALAGRATDISGAGTARSQDITLQGQQFNNALDLQKYVNGLINNPTDFVNRARLSAGLAPLGGGMITQADLVNAAKNAMGSQNFQTVRDALLPAPFVTAPKTALPQFAGPTPVMPRGAANVPVVPPVVAPKVTTQPTPVTNPAAPTIPAWAAALAANPQFNGSTPTPVTGAAVPTGAGSTVARASRGYDEGDMGGVREGYVYSREPAAMPSSGYSYDPGDMGGVREGYVYSPPPAAMPSSGDLYDTGDMGGARIDAGYNPNYVAPDYSAPYVDYSPPPPMVYSSEEGDMGGLSEPAGLSYSYDPGDMGGSRTDMGGDGMAYGGATRDPRFIVGDRRDGRPSGNEEMIINPTRAPIQVIPNSRLAAYYGGTMPNRFAGGTNSRLGMYPMSGYARGTDNQVGMYPRYDKGTDAINFLSNLFGNVRQGLGREAQTIKAAGASLKDIAGGMLGYTERPSSPSANNQGVRPAQQSKENYQYPNVEIGPKESGMFEYVEPYPGMLAEKAVEDAMRNALDAERAALDPETFGVNSNIAPDWTGTGSNKRYAYGTDSRLGMYPRYADGVLPSVQGAPVGSLSPVTQQDLVNSAREYSPPAVGSLLGDRGAFEARMLPVQSASMRQTNNLTPDEIAALGTRLALEGTSQQEYNALQKGLFGQQRTTRRGRLVV